MKRNFKYNRKAFTLVELLIVIAIIGILFVVLVSKVDFATDKANATGVQTDFRSFQIAFETVSRENAGFNTLGWDTGDANGDRVRNSYDKGDANQNGICEESETWTGQKVYSEIWTGVYTLDNPADADDMSAYLALEKAINKNLDPALQISIDPENKTIYMANGYQDPWKTEYHGFYLSNANVDGMDRGAIVLYSDGPNKIFGSEQTIAKGKVTVTVKNGGINGQDDMALVTCYTYMNGYGEVATMTEGFSNNQVLSGNGNSGVENMFTPGGNQTGPTMLSGPTTTVNSTGTISIRSSASIDSFQEVKLNGVTVDPDNYTVEEGSIIITFKESYIYSLDGDTYEVTVVSSEGDATCELVVNIQEYYVSGVYLLGTFNAPATSIYEAVNIEWDNGYYNYISINQYGLSLEYYDGVNIPSPNYLCGTDGWYYDTISQRTLDFGLEPQAISKELYDVLQKLPEGIYVLEEGIYLWNETISTPPLSFSLSCSFGPDYNSADIFYYDSSRNVIAPTYSYYDVYNFNTNQWVGVTYVNDKTRYMTINTSIIVSEEIFTYINSNAQKLNIVSAAGTYKFNDVLTAYNIVESDTMGTPAFYIGNVNTHLYYIEIDPNEMFRVTKSSFETINVYDFSTNTWSSDEYKTFTINSNHMATMNPEFLEWLLANSTKIS